MPSIRHIPESRERLCEPCEYHKCMGALYGSDHSWRDYNCMHPAAFDDVVGPHGSGTNIEAAKHLEIRARLLESGRHIGKTEQQPAWCPLRRGGDEQETLASRGD